MNGRAVQQEQERARESVRTSNARVLQAFAQLFRDARFVLPRNFGRGMGGVTDL